ncbi:hypothetical protein P4S72_16205 [Vibrio sp. PP-XX7]
MAYELRDKLSRDDEVTVINLGDTYSFVPSNPWVAVGWRAREDVEVDLKPVFNKRHITLRPEGAARVYPDRKSCGADEWRACFL